MSSRAVLALAGLALAGLAMLAACASQTPVGTGATPAAAAAPTGAAAATRADAATPEQRAIRKYGRDQGYKPVVRNGDTVWCKSEKRLGSTLEQLKCVSETTLADAQKQAELNRQDLQRQSVPCIGPACSHY